MRMSRTTLKMKEKEKSCNDNYMELYALFTPAERLFLNVLHEATKNDNEYILGKVPIGDVITPKNGISGSECHKLFNKISRDNFEFLLCDKKDLSVVCAIELNGCSPNSRKRIERDIFLENGCKSVGIPFIQIEIKPKYDVDEIKKIISNAVVMA